MEKEFVIYELAIRMKALDYKERVLTYYENGVPKLHNDILGWDFNSSFLTCCSRPTYSQAFRWFREEYDMHYNIHRFNFKKGTDEEYLAEVDSTSNFSYFRKYDECVVFCLEKLIEIVEGIESQK